MSDSAYIVTSWLGRIGDSETIGVNATLDGAKERCNEHRKTCYANPIRWEEFKEDYLQGSSGGWDGTHEVMYYLILRYELGE